MHLILHSPGGGFAKQLAVVCTLDTGGGGEQEEVEPAGGFVLEDMVVRHVVDPDRTVGRGGGGGGENEDGNGGGHL